MMPSKSFVFRFDDVEVREREFTLIKAGKVSTVEPKAFRTLLFLLHNPQRLIAKEELLNTVWGDAAVTEGSLTRCIWLLRTALGDDIHQPRYIKTVATVGYRFVCKVEVSEEASGNLEATGEPDGLESAIDKASGPAATAGRLSIARNGRGEAEGHHRKSFPKVGRHPKCCDLRRRVRGGLLVVPFPQGTHATRYR
jgi:DNA-binding winged helix-turn-helix (wHTH) protein